MADLVTSRVFVDGEKGITAAKLNDIVASSVIQPAFYTSKPTAGTADPTDIALILKSGAYAQVPVSTLGGSATQSQIWSTRLRSFNAIGNPSFESDQRNVGTALTNPANGTFALDRYAVTKATSTLGYTTQRITLASPVLLPGTSFAISNGYLRLTLTTAQATLAAGDFWRIHQFAEGPQLRELIGDVHSVSLLVRSSVSPLNFSLALSDNPVTKSLVKLCAYTAPSNTWQVISLPNIPVWPTGNFAVTPGSNGYLLYICLACGTTGMSPANDTWQNGNFLGAPGMSNFAASPVNSTFDIAFVQHEPGAVCSTFIDKPFSQNYDECLRYYCKSYDYATKPGTVVSANKCVMSCAGPAAPNTVVYGSLRFPKPMAKAPTVNTWSPDTGAGSAIRDAAGSVDRGVSSYADVGTTGFDAIILGSAMTSNSVALFHYTADTGM